MLEVGILKNFDSGTYKASVQLAGSLTTYFDDISVAKNIPSSALVIGNYVILAIPGDNAKDACVIATWPQGSPGPASFLDLPDTPSSYSGQAGQVAKVNSDETALEFGKITGDSLSQDFGASSLRLYAWNFQPKQGTAFHVANAATSPFSGKINGNPTATSVVYDNESNENCLNGLRTGSNRWGRFILHNTTKDNSRLVVSWDVATNTITTESSTDNWADNDNITLQSQTCAQAGYMDVDLSDEINSDEVVAYIQFEILDKSGSAVSGRRVMVHPYEIYDMGKRLMCPAALANEFSVNQALIPIIDQKICVFFDKSTNAAIQIAVLATSEYADT